MAVETKSGQRIFSASNGVKIPIKPVSLLLGDDIAASVGRPEQPTIMIDGLDGPHEMIDMSEAAQKAYNIKLEKFQEEVNNLYLETVIELGCDIEFGEKEQKIVDDYREKLSKRGKHGITIQSTNDIYVYVAYILIPDVNEVRRLNEAITNLNQATKDQLEKARDSFRS
jgi:hypothetical protein